jgi:hypothetical protein
VGCEGTDEIIATLAPIPIGISHAVRAATGLPVCGTEGELQIFYAADWHRSNLTERCAHCETAVPPRMVERNWSPWGVEVDQATGMVTVQAGVDIFEALTLLIEHANASGRTVEDTAVDVINGRLRFDNNLA